MAYQKRHAISDELDLDVRGPAGLHRADFMEKWRQSNPEIYKSRSRATCTLCKCGIDQGNRIRSATVKSYVYLVHDECFDVWT